MSDKQFSDEFLNAFIDDQLAPEEKSRAYSIIDQDKALSQQVCGLRKMRDLVQLAYKDVPNAPSPKVRQPHSFARRYAGAAAAGFVLSVGVAMGWVLRGVETQPHDQDVAAQAPAVGTPELLHTSVAGNEVKIVLHINRGTPEAMKAVLDEAESVLSFYQGAGVTAVVEVIANGDGLDLLRADRSPFAARIKAMQKHYDNLSFAACQNTIDRLKREQGIQARLIPEATVIDSGVAQIILLQQQGWAYVQV